MSSHENRLPVSLAINYVSFVLCWVVPLILFSRHEY